MSCPTQAWVNATESLFVLKGSGQTFDSPFTVRSEDFSNSLVFTVDNNIPFSKATIQYIQDGVTGGSLNIDSDAVFIKFTTLTSAAVFTQNYTELFNQVYLTDPNNTLAYFTIDANSAVGGSIIYSDPNSSILFSPQGNVQINTYVAVEQSGLTLTVLDATQRSTQITSHDILFSDISQNPIGGMYANGTAISLGTSNFGSTPAITIDYGNNVTVNSGVFAIQQNSPAFASLESSVAILGNPDNVTSPSFYILNSKINNGSVGRIANSLSFFSGFNGVTTTYMWLNAGANIIGLGTPLWSYYDAAKGAGGSGILRVVQGGTGSAYAGDFFTDADTNGAVIRATGPSGLANLNVLGATVQIGTVSQPTVATVNGNAIPVFPPFGSCAITPGTSGDFLSLPAFPTLSAPYVIMNIPLYGLNTLSSFVLNVVANGWSNDSGGGATVMLSYFGPSDSSTTRLTPTQFMAGNGATACLTTTTRFVQGVNYTSTQTNLYIQINGTNRYMGVTCQYSIS